MDKFVRTALAMGKKTDFIKETMKNLGISKDEANRQYDDLMDDEIYVNDVYQVNIDREPRCQLFWGNSFPKVIHVSVKRLDKEPIHDWRDLQVIKNELVGEEHDAFELYPAESRLVDTVNQYHLWVFVDPEVRLPVGWNVRMVDDEAQMPNSKQRSRK